MNQNEKYLQAVQRVLLALCKGFVKRGITLPIIVSMLKQSIIQAAVEQTKNNAQITNSRISLLTGVHRKDVSAMKNLPSTKIFPKSLNARVLAKWTGDHRFLKADGSPAKLARSGPNSFEDLVVSVSKDIRPRTLLDEWIRQGVISIDDSNAISLVIKDYKPTDAEEESLYFFGENLADHIEVCTHNLLDTENRLFERASYADGLSYKSVKKLESIVNDRAMKMLVEINKIAFQLAKEDKQKKEIKYRYKLGTYFYQSEQDNQIKDESTAENVRKKNGFS